MLRKILLVLVLISLTVAFGCKKKEAEPVMPSMTDIQKQAETAGQDAAKKADAAKTEAGKEMEKAGEELQK